MGACVGDTEDDLRGLLDDLDEAPERRVLS